MTDQTALARAFTALADPTRREIFERVASRAQAVGELAGDLPVSRPAVSQHLKVLSDAGLVTARADGTRRELLRSLRAELARTYRELETITQDLRAESGGTLE